MKRNNRLQRIRQRIEYPVLVGAAIGLLAALFGGFALAVSWVSAPVEQLSATPFENAVTVAVGLALAAAFLICLGALVTFARRANGSK